MCARRHRQRKGRCAVLPGLLIGHCARRGGTPRSACGGGALSWQAGFDRLRFERAFSARKVCRIVLTLLKSEFRKLGRENSRSGSPAAYVIAVICVADAVLAHLAFAQFIKDISPSILSYAAIFIAALLGGARVGVITAAVSMMIGWWSFDSLYFSNRISGLGRLINFGLYIAVAGFTVFLAECFRRAGPDNLQRVKIVPADGDGANGQGATTPVTAGSRLHKLLGIWREGLRSNWLAAYTFALGCVVAGTLIRIGFGWLDDIILPFACFYPAVLLVSLIGGMEAALLAMILSMVVVGWAFYPPFYSFGPPTRGQIIDMGLFLFASLLSLWLAEKYRRVLPRLRADQAERLSFYAPIVVSFGVVLFTTLILVAIGPYLEAQYLVMGYLIPTAVVAILYGSTLAFLTSFASALAAAYFLFPPDFSVYIEDTQHIVAVVLFVIVAIFVGHAFALATFGVKRDRARGPREDNSLFIQGNASRGRTGVLLIHSLGGTPLELRTVAVGLAERGFTVSCCQLAGHGDTENELLATRWSDWFASAEQALAELEKRCDVIVVGGLSVGSILALRLAALNPSRVHGLCLFAPTLRYDGWAMPWYSFLLMLGVRAPFLRRMRFADPPPYGIKDEASRAMIADAMQAGQSTQTSSHFTSLGTLQESHWLVRDVVRRLESIKAPALIIHPREDDISDLSNTIYLQRRLGGLVECLVLDDSYHLITVDRQRDLVMNRTADFIAFIERFTARKRPDSTHQRPSVVAGREFLAPARPVQHPQGGST
jgi:carboxylesterase